MLKGNFENKNISVKKIKYYSGIIANIVPSAVLKNFTSVLWGNPHHNPVKCTVLEN